MARTRIGEALVARGLITEEELAQALRWQVVVGVHLGTAVIELGFAEESDVGETLAEIQGVRYAARDRFEAIPAEALEAVPADVVRRKCVVPIALRPPYLHVAAIEAKNLAGLSVSTGYRIVPLVAPEYRIRMAMERYYGIPAPVRLVEVTGPRRSRRQGGGAFAPPAPAVTPARRPRRPATPSAGAGSAAEIEELSRRLSAVDDHARLGESILEFVAERASRCILFDASGENARPVQWRGIDPLPRSFPDSAVPVTAESVLGLAADEPCYRGPLPQEVGRAFYHAIGLDEPREILVVPIYGDERLEAVLYADAGPSGWIAGAPDVWNGLSESIELAMRMLAIKRRLRAEREQAHA